VDLVLDKMVELEHVDVADGDVPVERLARSPVAEHDLAVLRKAGEAQLLADLLLGRTVEDGRRGLEASLLERPPEVGLQDLADVHSARHAERVEDDVDRGSVRQVRHVFRGQNPGDDALVAVAAGHLVADADLALLGNRDPDQAVHARHEFVAFLAAEDPDIDDLAALAVRQAEGRVLHFAGLLAEDRAEESFLCGQFGLALGSDLADQDVAGLDFGTDVNDAFFVQVLERLLADVRDVSGDLFGAELGVAGLQLVLLDMDAGEEVFLDQSLVDDDGVFVVATLPAHERHEDVAAESQLALLGGAGVCDRVVLLKALADVHDGALVDACALVGADVLLERVDVEFARVGFHLDPVRGHAGDHAGALGDDDLTGVQGGAPLHAGADDRRLRLQKRHGLALHVGTHEGSVGVVVLEERDQGRGH
jgi:hypothetical protein